MKNYTKTFIVIQNKQGFIYSFNWPPAKGDRPDLKPCGLAIDLCTLMLAGQYTTINYIPQRNYFLRKY